MLSEFCQSCCQHPSLDGVAVCSTLQLCLFPLSVLITGPCMTSRTLVDTHLQGRSNCDHFCGLVRQESGSLSNLTYKSMKEASHGGQEAKAKRGSRERNKGTDVMRRFLDEEVDKEEANREEAQRNREGVEGMALWPLEQAEPWLLEQPSPALSFPFHLFTWKMSNLCKGEQHSSPPTPPPVPTTWLQPSSSRPV